MSVGLGLISHENIYFNKLAIPKCLVVLHPSPKCKKGPTKGQGFLKNFYETRQGSPIGSRPFPVAIRQLGKGLTYLLTTVFPEQLLDLPENYNIGGIEHVYVLDIIINCSPL